MSILFFEFQGYKAGCHGDCLMKYQVHLSSMNNMNNNVKANSLNLLPITFHNTHDLTIYFENIV